MPRLHVFLGNGRNRHLFAMTTSVAARVMHVARGAIHDTHSALRFAVAKLRNYSLVRPCMSRLYCESSVLVAVLGAVLGAVLVAVRCGARCVCACECMCLCGVSDCV
jgi:hypothetical protein